MLIFQMMRRLIVIWASVLVGTLCGAEPPAGLEDVFARAATDRKPVLLSFPSTENSPSLGALNVRPAAVLRRDRFIEKEIFPHDPALILRYRIILFPTLLVLRPDGSELDRVAGAQSESETTAILKNAAEGNPLLPQLKTKAKGSNKIEDHGRLGDALLKRAFFPEALEEYTWCLNDGLTADPAGFRRLVKTIIERVRELQLHLPQAKDLLLDLQRKSEARLSSGGLEDYITTFSVNEALGQPERNVPLFCDLPPASPMRCDLLPSVFQDLVKAKRYREATLTIDVETFVGRLFPLQVIGDIQHSPGDLHHTHRIAAEARQRAISLTVNAVEATIGIQHLEKAKRLAGRLIDWDSTEDIRTQLRAAASRAQTPSSSKFISWLGEYAPPADSAGTSPASATPPNR